MKHKFGVIVAAISVATLLASCGGSSPGESSVAQPLTCDQPIAGPTGGASHICAYYPLGTQSGQCPAGATVVSSCSTTNVLGTCTTNTNAVLTYYSDGGLTASLAHAACTAISGTWSGCGASGESCCAGTSCNSGLTCTSGTCQIPTACGASGEPCCAGTSCNSGLTCTSGTCQTPTACGASGEPCCAGTSCNSGLTCTSGTCQTPAVIPLAPSNMIVSGVTQTTATLGWRDNATDETSYIVGRCTGLASVDSNGVRHCVTGFQQVATATANATSYTLTGLTAGTAYGFYVLARNAAGDSGNVGVEFTTVPATTTLTVVNNHCLPITEFTLNGGANLLTYPIDPGNRRTITVQPGTYTIYARSPQDSTTWRAERTIPAVGLVLPLDMPAETGCLRVQNVSGYTIYELFVNGMGWGCSNGIWGQDYITGAFPSDSSFTISQMSAGHYDLLAYNSGRTLRWWNCSSAAITIVAGQTTVFNLTP